jgi:pyruvate,water dikinase
MERTLDQVGRLLACSHLLDMAIVNEAAVPAMIDAFFQGNYDFLNRAQEPRLEGFYTHVGDWEAVTEEGRTVLRQDGTEYRSSLGTGLAKTMGKMMGSRYQDFPDNIQAYFYFPLAIASESEVADATLWVRVKSTAGYIDQAGGLAFGIKNVANYFVWRINALEDNVIIFEYVNSQRFQRARLPQKINTGEWYDLKVEVSGAIIRGFVNEELLLEYDAAKPVTGYVGLWTKADSVSFFQDLSIQVDGKQRNIKFWSPERWRK